MKSQMMGSIFILLYVNLLPYVCRLYRGVEWSAQYLPDPGHRILGFIFFGAFASLPAIPLIFALRVGRRARWSLVLSFIVVSYLLISWHHDYDLATDAQAAIGLLFIPIYTFGLTIIATLVGLAAQWGFEKIKER